MDPTQRERKTDLSNIEKFIKPSWKKGTTDESGKQLEGFAYMGRVFKNFADSVSVNLSRVGHAIKKGEWLNNDKIQAKLETKLYGLVKEIHEGNELIKAFKKVIVIPNAKLEFSQSWYTELRNRIDNIREEIKETSKVIDTFKGEVTKKNQVALSTVYKTHIDRCGREINSMRELQN